jgi:hypothetical protein
MTGAASEAKVSLNRLGQFIRARTPETERNLDFSKALKRGT